MVCSRQSAVSSQQYAMEAFVLFIHVTQLLRENHLNHNLFLIRHGGLLGFAFLKQIKIKNKITIMNNLHFLRKGTYSFTLRKSFISV